MPLDFKNKYKTILFVRFAEIEFVGGKDVVPMLQEFVGITESCVAAIEAETERLIRENG